MAVKKEGGSGREGDREKWSEEREGEGVGWEGKRKGGGEREGERKGGGETEEERISKAELNNFYTPMRSYLLVFVTSQQYLHIVNH